MTHHQPFDNSFDRADSSTGLRPIVEGTPLAQVLHSGILFVLLVLGAAGLVSAASNPGYLTESTSNVPGGTKTYRVWYTTDCNGGADCECDNAFDTDTDDPPDGVLDKDSPNDCIATTDSDSDGIFDTGPDDDSDGVLDVVDADWTGSGTGVVESVPYNVQRTLDVYVNDWSLKEPKWDTDTNRSIYVYNIDAYGFASSNGSGIALDAAWMLHQAPEPRGSTLHELWHMTQYAYGAGSGSDGKWLIEGQARMMQDKVFDDLDNLVSSRYHDSVNTYLGNTTYVNWEDRDDDKTAEFAQADGLLGASYNASLWWTYLADQAGTQYAGTAGDGVDLLEGVLEQSDDHDRHGVDAVDQELRDRIGQGFDDTFWDFTIANYAKDFDLSRLDHDDLGGRDPETVLKYSDEKRTDPDKLIYGPVERQTFDIADLMAGVSGSVNAMDSEVNDEDAMSAYGANYYEGSLENSDNCALAYWRVIGEDGARFMHSWLLIEEDSNGDGDEEVVSLLRSEGQDFARAVWNTRQAYTRMVGIVATASEPYGYDWEMGCTTPSIDIVEPKTDNPAYVGDPGDPGRFLLWLKVTGSTGTSTYVAGLDWSRDFTVTVGSDPAEILSGGYVQNQYWLVVQAPQKAGASVGDKFDLTVELGPTGVGASDTETGAVIYDLVVSDQVLVIDRSGSMASNSKIDSAKTAARLFADAKQEFDKLGVVSFSADATEEYSLTTVPDQDDAAGVRADAQDAIDAITTDTTTSIGDGLQKGQDMLNADGNPGHQWVMVLLSDGMENESLFWDDVKAGITAKVHAIALGQDADEELMREIAETTCGDVGVDECYHYIEESGVLATATTGLNAATATSTSAALSTSLPNALADLYRRIEESIVGHQRLWQDSGSLSGSQTINVDLAEDSVREALFSFNWNDASAPLNVSITGPGGVSFIELSDGQNHTVFYTDTMPSGVYTVSLSASSGTSEWIGSLAGRVIHGTELHAFLDNPQSSREPGLPIRLQAILTDNQGGVAGATVIADVHRPDGGTEQVQLVDDGGPWDDIAGDGVYSYVYDRINRPLAVDVAVGHSWVFDLHASGVNNSGNAFERYKQLTYTPYLGQEQRTLDADGDGMLDIWEDRFGNVDSSVPDGTNDPDNDGLTNKEEFERGTNPDDPDTDKGGETDGSEVAKGQNPLLTADDTIPSITDFWVENLPESVVLHFNPRPEYQAMQVFRRTGSTGPFNLIGTFDPSSGQITDTLLINDQDYFYYIQPQGTSGATGRPSRVLYAEPAADPYQPEGIVVINDDDRYTLSKNVTLSFQGLTLPDGTLDVRYVQISNSPDLHGAPWLPFTLRRSWTIDPDPDTGAAFVYVRFLDGAGNVSDVIYGDGIVYKAPVSVSLPAGPLDFGRVIADFSDPSFAGLTITYTVLSKPRLPLRVGPALSSTEGSMNMLSTAQDSGELRFGGIAFNLKARDAGGHPVTQFGQAFTLEIHYEDWQWQSGGIGYEELLNLYWDTGTNWQPVLPCDGCSIDTENNVIIVTLDHLTEFALAGIAQVPEDVDRDGDVDILDLANTAAAWRRTVADSGYSLAYDVNKDGVINIIDLQRIAARWGWQLPR
jgi:hypothetical protein